MGPHSERPSRLLWWIAQAAVLFAWWLLLVGTTDTREVLAGAAAALAGAIAMHVVAKQHLAKFMGRLDWLLQIWRMPKYVLTGTWRVLNVLTRQLVGRRPAPSLLLEVDFDACGNDDASSTKRALAVAYTTMTPNFVVIGIDQDRCKMVYHQVRKSEVPQMTRRLGARA